MSTRNGAGRGGAKPMLSAGMLEKLREQRGKVEKKRDLRTTEKNVPSQKKVRGAFEDHPAYKSLQIQKAAAKIAGVKNPFHRSHDIAAGAETMIDGRKLINFASYDYLGTNTHPDVHEAVRRAIQQFGVSSSASRLVAGERPLHVELEKSIAENYGVEAAVCFVSGYLTNLSAISCLMTPQDLIIHDEFIHNSALTGAQLSGAKRLVFKHNDMADLERILSGAAQDYRNVLVIVEGVYSMDGDIADLPTILRLRDEYPFWLMVDEAHALGVLGAQGRGTFEHFGIDPTEIDIWMGTLSKTSSSCGGYIAGNGALVEILKGHAGGFVYSVGLAPPLAAAAIGSLAVLRQEPQRVRQIYRNGQLFLDTAKNRGLDTGTSAGFSVVPVIVGDSLCAVELSNRLFEAGINALPIIHPAVPERLARIRFFLTAEHTEEQICRAVETTAKLLEELVAQNISAASLNLDELQRIVANR
ncbi:aminotransferase class I/II-fold pyridoxal phosphate-dependent enzyme [Rhizobium sp. UGM030330-04]|uniref:aminotransferase class I/II-fold pyridoxal phosphate-dependent enzyme n=1 Tax=Rhizobium sp. UGM030330-04 TaxID=1378077 RepID=UPI0025710CD9|nr:aminotransferase class I/II-fold pyridoxal phosphate-dependent enzyme [Rhizobium sp. UGM030330-04]